MEDIQKGISKPMQDILVTSGDEEINVSSNGSFSFNRNEKGVDSSGYFSSTNGGATGATRDEDGEEFESDDEDDEEDDE